MRGKKKNWAETSRETLLRYPVIIVSALIITFISQLIILAQGIEKGKVLFDGTLGWRSSEEKVINRLAPSVDIGLFKKRLGDPLFVRTEDSLTEYSFRRKGYWVQAITNPSGSVQLFAVTVCDDSFHPKIEYNPAGNPIVIGKTTLDKVVVDANDSSLAHYSISGATANSYLLEEAYLGNPSNYQTVLWGLNDICLMNEYLDDNAFEYLGNLKIGTESGTRIQDSQIQAIRKKTRINTFGISAPFAKTDDILTHFQLGVDRVLIRTVPGQL